jgi:hypothetical protein
MKNFSRFFFAVTLIVLLAAGTMWGQTVVFPGNSLSGSFGAWGGTGHFYSPTFNVNAPGGVDITYYDIDVSQFTEGNVWSLKGVALPGVSKQPTMTSIDPQNNSVWCNILNMEVASGVDWKGNAISTLGPDGIVRTSDDTRHQGTQDWYRPMTGGKIDGPADGPYYNNESYITPNLRFPSAPARTASELNSYDFRLRILPTGANTYTYEMWFRKHIAASNIEGCAWCNCGVWNHAMNNCIGDAAWRKFSHGSTDVFPISNIDLSSVHVFMGLGNFQDPATHSLTWGRIEVTGTPTSIYTVNVTVKQSDGTTPINGVYLRFSQNNFNTFVTATTDINGVATKDLAAGTWKISASYQNTSTIQTMIVGTDPDPVFYTSDCRAQVYKHDGTALSGVRVLFSPTSGFGNYVSVNTDAGGLAKTELFPGTMYLKAIVSSTSNVQSVALTGDGKTSGQGSLVAFYTSEMQAQVNNHLSAGIAGVLVQFSPTSGFGNYVSVNTDGSGLAKTELFPGTCYIRANYRNGSATQSTVLAGNGMSGGAFSLVIFYTTGVTAVVKSCMTGNVVPGASFRFNPGTTESGTWVTGSAQELFAGTWYVAVDIYGNVRNAQTVSVPGNNTAAGQTLIVTFLTTRVTGGTGTFYMDPSPTGQYNYFRLGPFTSASVIELLPGSYYVKKNSTNGHYANGTIVGPYAISGCSFILPHQVTLKTSAGVGIPNVTVSYNNNGGGAWLNTTTDANGVATIPGGQNFVDLRNYNLGTTGWVNTGGADITFYTTAVTAEVRSCVTGNVVPGASFRFNPGTSEGGNWITGSPQELLAGTWYVAVDIYGNVRNAQTPTIPGNNTTAGQTLTVTFLTTQVTGSGAGTFYIDPSQTGQYDYYRLGPFTTASVIELLPGSYYFKNNSTTAHKSNGTIIGPFAISGCSMAGVGVPAPRIAEEQSELIPADLVPTEFGLAQNYPNPFNPSTTLRYALPVDATVTLEVYDILGEKVAQLVNGPVVAGYHDVVFDATNLPSGIYFYRMSAAANGNYFTRIEKMMLLK